MIRSALRAAVLVCVCVWLTDAAPAGPAEIPAGFAVLGTTIPTEWESLTVPAGWERGRLEEDPGRETSVGNTKMPPVTDADKARGFVVFCKNYCDLVFPQTAPTPQELEDSISISACPGEYEPFTVGVRALNALPALRARITEFAGAKATIPTSNTDVRTVRVMPRMYYPGGGVAIKKYVDRPVLLERRRSVAVAGGTTQQIWVTVKIPDDAPAGEYRATLRIEGGQGGSVAVPVALRVLPIRLEDPDVTYAMYHVMNVNWPGSFHDRKGELRRHLIDMREHGMNSDLIYTCPFVEKTGQGYRVDFSRKQAGTATPDTFEKTVQAMLDLGMTRPIIWYMPSLTPPRYPDFENPADFYREWSQVIRLVEAERKRRNWPEFIYSPNDESDASAQRAEECRGAVQCLKGVPVRSYMTVVGTEHRHRYLPFTDMPAYSALIFRAEFIAEAGRTGKTLASYNGAGRYGLDPKSDRFWYGLWNAKVGCKALTSWTYQWPGGPAARSPYDAFCGMTGNGAGYYYAFPTTDGLLPSIGWEGVREGIDDARYVHTLRQWISRARTSGDAAAGRLADKAETALAAVLDGLNINQGNDPGALAIRTQADSLPGAEFDRCRQRWVSHILRLQEAVAAANGN